MRRAWSIVGALVVTLALPLAGAAQGLGDAAKKEKDRLAQGHKSAAPAKSFTQEDLQKGKAEAPSPAASEATSAQTGQASATPSTVEQASADSGAHRQRHEEWWRKELARAEADVDQARRIRLAAERWTVQPDDPSCDQVRSVNEIRTLNQTGICSDAQLRVMRATVKAELDAAEEALERARESARRAGFPPESLR